jgi:hypothetical protein
MRVDTAGPDPSSVGAPYGTQCGGHTIALMMNAQMSNKRRQAKTIGNADHSQRNIVNLI